MDLSGQILFGLFVIGLDRLPKLVSYAHRQVEQRSTWNLDLALQYESKAEESGQEVMSSLFN
jgi:hypothetical protein